MPICQNMVEIYNIIFYLFVQVKCHPFMKCLRAICSNIALIGICKASETSDSYTTTQNHMKAEGKRNSTSSLRFPGKAGF